MPASPAPTMSPQPGPFVCYSRKDQAYVRSLVAALAACGRDAWADWQDVLPTAEWMREIQAGIDAAPAVLVVLSPDAAASEVCALEIAYALGQNKRLIPILCRAVDPKTVAEPVRKLHWIDLQGDRLPDDGIDALLTALDTDLQWVHAHSRLLQQAGEWDANNQDAGRLLRGAPLADAERWLGRTDTTRMPQPTALQLQYVLASGKAQARRRRLALAGVSGTLVVTAALAVMAVVQSRIADQQRDTAVSRLLAAQSTKNTTDATGRPDLALLQAVAALQLDATDEARASLWRALLATDRVRRFVQAPGTLLCVALHPDGRTLATGGFDGTLTLWDAQTLQPKAILRGDQGGVRALAFSPDGSMLASAGVKGLVLRDARTAQVRLAVDGPRGGVSRLAWHPHGQTLFAASRSDGTLHIVELAEPVRRSAVPVHRRGLRDIAISADARTLAIAVDGDPRIRLWDVEARRERQQLSVHEAEVKALAYSPDGRWLASAGNDAVVHLWDASTGAHERALEGPSAQVERLAFSADGRWLGSAHANRSVTLWSLQQPDAPPESLRGHSNGLMDLVFAPDAKTLFSVAFTDTFIAWNLDQRRQAAVLESHQGDVTALAVSRDGTLLASGGDDGAVRLWTLGAQTLLATLPGHRGPVRTLAFSPDGGTLSSGSDDDRLIRLWDVAKRQPRQQLDARGEVTGLDFSPDGTLLASSAEGRGDIQLWSAGTGEPAAELKGHEGQVNTLMFSRDGRKLVSGGSADQAVRVWDPVTKSQLGEPMVIGASVAQVAISPDGATVASSAHGPGGVLLWELAGDKPPIVVQEPGSGGDQRLAFSPDGQMLAHAADELRSSIVLWGLASRRPLALLEGGATTLALAFTPDGRLASGHAGGDQPGRIVLWNTEVGRWPERACEIANRNLTREEWRASVGPGLPYRTPCPSLPSPKD